MTGVRAQADGGMQPGSKERRLGCSGDAQRSSVAHGGYGSSEQKSIHGLFTLYIKWQLYCINKAPGNKN